MLPTLEKDQPGTRLPKALHEHPEWQSPLDEPMVALLGVLHEEHVLPLVAVLAPPFEPLPLGWWPKTVCSVKCVADRTQNLQCVWLALAVSQLPEQALPVDVG